jgi:ankyrin repeat protein
VATEEGDLEVIRALFEHDADANALDNDNKNALHLASQGGYWVELMELLLSVDQRNKVEQSSMLEAP